MLEDASTWTAHDTQSGAALQDLEARELKRVAQEKRNAKPVAQRHQPSEAQVIAQLVDAAMPAVVRDSKELQRVRSNNELQRRKDEQARQREAMSLPAYERY